MTIEEGRLSRSALPPASLLPGDPGYDEARISFNGMLDRRPAAIVPCTTTAEVQAAVRAARAADLPIAVRGGGHSVAGHGIADDALVVSLAAMRQVTVDPVRRTADAGGGALWEDVDGATTAHGLAVPGGTFVDTGIGGLTLGGGIGWLMPLAGLTCDNLVSAEVVTADGSVAIAGDDGGDPDLLWALRGGGGNFGVVTRFTYRLGPVGPIFGGFLRYPVAAAPEVLARVERMIAEHPTATMPTLTIRRNPDFGNVISLLLGIVDGSDPEPILAILRDGLPRVLDDVGPMTYPQLQAITGLIPFGMRHYWKGHFLRDLDGDTLAAVADAAIADPVGPSFVLIEGIVGAARTEPEGGAAFGQRAARWNASALAIWESPDDDDAAVRWTRRVADLLAGASLSGGGYVNYSPVDETAERVHATYGGERWNRLVAVKRRYDPDNVFRFNHNIPPG